MCSSDSESEGRGSSGLAEEGRRRRGNMAEERDEPSDGGAGERTLEQPGQPRPLALGKKPTSAHFICVADGLSADV